MSGQVRRSPPRPGNTTDVPPYGHTAHRTLPETYQKRISDVGLCRCTKARRVGSNDKQAPSIRVFDSVAPALENNISIIGLRRLAGVGAHHTVGGGTGSTRDNSPPFSPARLTGRHGPLLTVSPLPPSQAALVQLVAFMLCPIAGGVWRAHPAGWAMRGRPCASSSPRLRMEVRLRKRGLNSCPEGVSRNLPRSSRL